MNISIITVSYNSSKTIRESIESVNNLDYQNLEHVFIDGKSSDNTLEIIYEFSTRKKTVICEKDKGIYDAFNKGVNNTKGDIVGFLHSDDTFAANDILDQVISVFSKYQDVDGVYGDLMYVDKLNTNKVIRYWKSKVFNQNLLKKGWMPAHPTLFLKKEIYDKHGSFDLNYKVSADYDFMVRILKDSDLNFKYLPQVVTKMKVGGNSNRSLSNIIKKSREDFEIIKKSTISKQHVSRNKKRDRIFWILRSFS